jgi:hypothetical protein
MPYTHLTENERYVITHLTSAGFSLREIALRIKSHHTTISRELKRNDDQVYADTVYWYEWTHPLKDGGRVFTGCCPNPFSLGLKRFLINLRLSPGNVKTRPWGSNS